MPQQKEDRGPGARKTKLEKRLNANADVMENADVDESEVSGGQQGAARGHKAQIAQPHRPGRPNGGNTRE